MLPGEPVVGYRFQGEMLERRQLRQEQGEQGLEFIADVVNAYDDGEAGDDVACLKSVGANHVGESLDVRVRSRVVASEYRGQVIVKDWERRIVLSVEYDVFIEVLYGYAVESPVGESEVEHVRGFGNVGGDKDEELIGKIEKYGHLGTQGEFCSVQI